MRGGYIRQGELLVKNAKRPKLPPTRSTHRVLQVVARLRVLVGDDGHHIHARHEKHHAAVRLEQGVGGSVCVCVCVCVRE